MNQNEDIADIVMADTVNVVLPDDGRETMSSPLVSSFSVSYTNNNVAVDDGGDVDVVDADDDYEDPVHCHHLNGKSTINNVQEKIFNDHGKKSIRTESLATTYGKRPSRGLLVSLLINIVLLLYAHIGLSAVILSNIERVETNTESGNGNTNNTNTNGTTGGACTMNESDLNRWYNTGGAQQKSIESSYCGTQYDGSGCLTGIECTIECFVTVWNYTKDCATCFGRSEERSVGKECRP